MQMIAVNTFFKRTESGKMLEDLVEAFYPTTNNRPLTTIEEFLKGEISLMALIKI